jgi:heterodisulfide reductase subunit A
MPISGKSVVIVGAGIGGLAVAKSLLANGVGCTIVEKESHLGGKVRDWACMATDQCLRCFCCSVGDLVEEVNSFSNAKVVKSAELSSMEAFHDGVRVGIRSLGSTAEEILEADALVVATGFQPYNPSEKLFWGYGRLNGVLTLEDMNAYVRNDDLAGFSSEIPDNAKIAFFQCVGSRDATIGANYCSQYCCEAALRMALKLRQEHEDWEITIFYIDLQVAGKFAGSLLEEARTKRIRLIQGVPGEIVQGDEDTLQVIREDAGSNVRENFHRIILSIGQRPSPDSSEIAKIAGMETNEFGFFLSQDALGGGRTGVARVYVAGTCGGPKDIEETLMDGGQTAAAIISDIFGKRS